LEERRSESEKERRKSFEVPVWNKLQIFILLQIPLHFNHWQSSWKHGHLHTAAYNECLDLLDQSATVTVTASAWPGGRRRFQCFAGKKGPGYGSIE